MTSTTPYIGSKISLISKAEIRYEGILYGIDAKESTVTLAKVTSFGTEERNAPKRIPAGSEVYEYIIFRGSDIKDLHVMPALVKQEVVDDPAIVSQLRPEVDAVHNTIPVSSMPAPSSFKPIPHIPPSEFIQQSPQDQPPAQQQQQPLPPMTFPPPPTAITTANSSVVSLEHPSVTVMMPAVASVASETTATSTVNSDITTTITTTGDTSVTTDPVTTITTTSSDKTHNDSKDSGGARGSNRGQQSQQKPRSAGYNKTHPTDANQWTDGARSGNRGRQQQSTAVTAGSRRRPYPSQYYSRGGYSYNEYQYNDNYYVYGNQRYSDRQGWSSQGSRGGSRGGRGQSGGYRNQQGGQGGRQQQQQPTGRGGQHKSTNTNAATKKSIKFDGDFDFESSNAKFKKEQMEEEFKQKLKLDGRKDSDSSDVHNQEEEDVIVDEVEDGEVVESTTSEPAVYYDSSKSFFDSISCEANKSPSDRRPTRNEEKTLNSETFGYSNPRGSRSRGRNQNYSSYQNQGGYYYSRGYQGGRRGGGYRQGGQYYAYRSSNPRGRYRSSQEQS